MNASSSGRAIARCALAALAVTSAALRLAAPAAADHPIANARAEGLSPMAVALITGGLALAAALLVLVIAMLLTRKSPISEQAGE